MTFFISSLLCSLTNEHRYKKDVNAELIRGLYSHLITTDSLQKGTDMTLPYYCFHILLIIACILIVWFSFRRNDNACSLVRFVVFLALIFLALTDTFFLRKRLTVSELHLTNELNDKTKWLIWFTILFPIIPEGIFKIIDHKHKNKKS